MPTRYFASIGGNVLLLGGGAYWLSQRGDLDINKIANSQLGQEVAKLAKRNFKPRI
jgi:hypothetical protein